MQKVDIKTECGNLFPKLDKLLIDNKIESEMVVNERNTKVCLIRTIYGREKFIGKALTDFDMLYDSSIHTLVYYDGVLEEEGKRLLESRRKGISRHY